MARYGGKRQTRAVEEFMYEKLVGLGFSKSDFTIVDESGKEIKETNPLQTKKLRKYREWAWRDSICRKEHRLIARENPSIFPLGKVYNSIA